MSNGYEKFFKDAKKAKAPQGERRSKTNSEDAIRAALNMQKSRTKKNKSSLLAIPWKLGLSLAIALAVAGAGLYYVDEIVNFVNRIEISALAGALAEEKTSPTKIATPANTATQTKAEENSKKSESENWNAEEVSHLKALSARKKELDQREAELSALEEELHKQRSEIEARLLKLEQVRAEISTVLKDRVEADEERIKTLVDFYSNMKPKQAAEVFANLNEDLAVEILGRMKKKNAADILNLLQPAKAKVLSEKYTGYKRR